MNSDEVVMSDGVMRLGTADLEVRRLEVRPGDVVVIRTAERLSEAQVARLVGWFKGALPEGVAVAVLDEGTDLVVLGKGVE